MSGRTKKPLDFDDLFPPEAPEPSKPAAPDPERLSRDVKAGLDMIFGRASANHEKGKTC